MDWRDFGYVTSVRDQGGCGSCYSIVTVGALEAIYAQTYRAPGEFSVQELVDCSKGNSGCDGGWLGESYQYFADKPSQWPDLEADYPYRASGGHCATTDRPAFHSLRCIGYMSLIKGDENEIYEALFHSPVQSAIVTTPELMLYENGVLENVCKDATAEPDHAVLVMGHGVDNGGRYWILKNSWGKDWGKTDFLGCVLVEMNVK